jgi:ABC-type uncharacterized transport system permease subunit
MWIYLIGFLAAVLAFYWYQLDMNVLKLHVTVQEAALHAATWGCVGGILRGLWYLKEFHLLLQWAIYLLLSVRYDFSIHHHFDL